MPDAPRARLRWFQWALVMSLNVTGFFATDSYIPSLPAMRHEFNTTAALAGLTLQGNWITRGLAILTLGALADRFGRRPVVCAAFAIFTVSTFASEFSPTIGFLIGFRVVQGFGEAGSSVTAAIVRDIVDDDAVRMRVNALMSTVGPLAIVAAPSVGGFVAVFFGGWRAVFGMLAAWGVLNCVLCATILPETQPTSAPSEPPPPPTTATKGHGDQGACRATCATLRQIVCERTSFALLLNRGLSFSATMVMISNIAYVLEGTHGLDTGVASLLIGSVATVILPTSLMVGMVGTRVSPAGVLRLGILVQAADLAAAVGVAVYAAGSLWAVMGVLYAMVLSMAIMGPPMGALYMGPHKHAAGLAGGVYGATMTLLSAAIAAVSTVVTERLGPRGMVLSIASCFAGCQLSYWTSPLAMPTTCSSPCLPGAARRRDREEAPTLIESPAARQKAAEVQLAQMELAAPPDGAQVVEGAPAPSDERVSA